jgi:predicted nuclease with TOPRIM domain
MAKDRKVQSEDESSGNESGNNSGSDDEFEAPTYDELVKLLKNYSKIIIKTRAKNEKLSLENDSLLDKYDIAEKASDELRDENKVVSSTLKELKTNLEELKEKHDKLERIHKELNTRHNLLKDEYTNLKINHEKLVLLHELLSNEPHNATNHVVKIDIATSCDDLIDESIEQGSNGKGKQVVVVDHYDDYVKLKSENEKFKKDLERKSMENTIVIETTDEDNVKALEIEKLREENKQLKKEKEHLSTSLHKFTKGHNL